MLSHPENRLRILAMPTISLRDVEETPRVAFVLIRHQNAHMIHWRSRNANVFLPDHRKKQRTSAVHDGDVRHGPVTVIRLQRLDDTDEKWVLGNRAHGVITDSCRHCRAYPSGVAEQRIQASVTAIVEIEINTAVVRENEVPDGIGALDGKRIRIEGFKKPGIFCCNEFARFGVCPELSSC